MKNKEIKRANDPIMFAPIMRLQREKPRPLKKFTKAEKQVLQILIRNRRKR